MSGNWRAGGLKKPMAIELIEDPRRTYYELAQQVRDYLHALTRVDPVEFSLETLAYHLRDLTPSFPWAGKDVDHFVRGKTCRFYESPFNLRYEKKIRAGSVLSLDELVAINNYAAGELEPRLKKLRDAKAVFDVPDELTIAGGKNELWFSFQTAVAGVLAYDESFNREAMKTLEELIAKHLRRKGLPVDLPGLADPAKGPG